MEKLSGPRVCTYAYPPPFAKKLQSLRRLSTQELIGKIDSAWSRIIRDMLHPAVFEVARIVVASDFDPAVSAAAREALAEVPGNVIYDCWEIDYFKRRFGICKLTPEYYLGAFFELLPRNLALEIYNSKFLNKYHSNDMRQSQPGRILLRFSAPEEAAAWITDLSDKSPAGTRKLLDHMARSISIRKYQDRRYEVEDVLGDIRPRIPQPQKIPERQMLNQARASNLPLYLAPLQELIQAHSITELSRMIAEARHPGSGTTLQRVIQLVAASQYHPRLMAPATELFSDIFEERHYQSRVDFDKFGLSPSHSPPLLMGALLETLPRRYAIQFLEAEFLAGRFADANRLMKAGRILLSFSCAARGADFSIDLLRANFKRARSVLISTLRSRAVRWHKFRRYDSSELFAEIGRRLAVSAPLSAENFPESLSDLS